MTSPRFDDEERLAPVSYLPGAGPAPSSDSASAAEDVFADGGASERKQPSDRRTRRAENVSIAALTRRGVSSRELHDLLLQRGFDDDEAARECERLEGVGLLDDAELARQIAHTQAGRKGKGRVAIAAELRRRKLDPSVVDAALAELDTDDEAERALELARDRWARLQNLDAVVAERRLYAYLQRRGFAGDVVRDAVRAVREESPAGSSGGVRFV